MCHFWLNSLPIQVRFKEADSILTGKGLQCRYATFTIDAEQLKLFKTGITSKTLKCQICRFSSNPLMCYRNPITFPVERVRTLSRNRQPAQVAGLCWSDQALREPCVLLEKLSRMLGGLEKQEEVLAGCFYNFYCTASVFFGRFLST